MQHGGRATRRLTRRTCRAALAVTLLGIASVGAGAPVDADVSLSSVCPVVGLGGLVTGDAPGGQATATTLSAPYGIAISPADGTVYVSERNWDTNTYTTGNGRIRSIAPSGIVSDLPLGPAGHRLGALAITPSGSTLYVATHETAADVSRVYAIDLTLPVPTWTVFAGGGTDYLGNGVAATSARFFEITDVEVSPTTGLLYIAGVAQNTTPEPEDTRPVANVGVVREVDGTGLIRTVVGGVRNTSVTTVEGLVANTAHVQSSPVTLAFDSAGVMNLGALRRVRRVPPAATANPYGDGIINTFSGANGVETVTGDGGSAAAARLGAVNGLALDPTGNLYVGGQEVHTVRRLDAGGTASTIANETGSPTSDAGMVGFADGAGDTARFAYTHEMAFSGGALYVVDSRNNRVRRVVPGATAALTTVSTFAGRGPNDVDTSGPALTRQTGLLDGLAVGPDGAVYLADRTAYRVWRRDTDGSMSAVAGDGTYRGLDVALPGGPATSNPLSIVRDVAVSPDNQTLYILERTRVLAVDLGTGNLSVLAGTGAIGQVDNPVGTLATLDTGAQGTMALGGGFIYVNGNTANIRRISMSTGAVDTPITGLGASVATNAIEADAAGNLFLGLSSHVIMYWPGNGSPVVVAGDSVFGNLGNGGPASAARIGNPLGLALLDRPGDNDVLYFSNGANPLRSITATSGTGAARWSGGTVSLVAGNVSNRPLGPGAWGDGVDISADPTLVRFNTINDIDLDPAGRLFIVDSNYGDSNPLGDGVTNTSPHQVRVLTDAGCSETAIIGPSSVAAAVANGVDLTDFPLGQIPFDLDAIAATPLRAVPLRAVPLRASPLRAVPLRAVPLRAVDTDDPPLIDVSLSSMVLDPVLYPDGWAARLVGTPFEGVPPQNVQLADLLDDPTTGPDETSPALTTAPEITLDSVDLSTSPLRAVSIASIALGSTPLRAVPLNETLATASDQDRFDAWCDLLATLGRTCDDLTPESPLLALEVKSVPLRAVPLRAVPLRAVDVSASPLRAVPLRAVGLEPTPLRSSPLRAVPLRAVAAASTPLRAVPLRAVNLDTSPLRAVILTNLGASASSVVTCDVGEVGCETLGDALGSLVPGATIGDLDEALDDPMLGGAIPTLGDLRWRTSGPDAFFGGAGATREVNLGDILRTSEHDSALPLDPFMSLADLLVGLVAAPDLPWEEVDLRAAGITTADAGPTADLDVSLRTYPGQTGPLAASVSLPEGWRYRATTSAEVTVDGTGAATPIAPLPEPVVTTTADVDQLAYSLPAGLPTPATITFRVAATPGLELGPVQADASTGPVIAGGAPSTVRPSNAMDVVDSTEIIGGAGSSYDQARNIVPDTLYTGYLNTAGDTDYYRVQAPGAGTLTTINLSHLPADADLVVYEESNSQLNLRSEVARLRQQSKPIEMVNPQVGVTGEPLEPQQLNDIAVLPDKTLAATSARAGLANESVELINDGDDDTTTADDDVSYVIAVTSYDDAVSADPYVLRVKQVVPPGALACAASGPGSVQLPPVPGGFTPSSAMTSIPAGTETLILVNRQRMAREFGNDATTTLTGELSSFAARSDVRGLVLPVDGDASVQSAYATWDASPCGLGRPNLVVREINDHIDALLEASPAARGTLRNVVIVGGDEQIPMARLLDNTKLSNEIEYGAELRRVGGISTPQTVALASKTVMSDDPFASVRPVLFGPDVIYPPSWTIGRLVETPTEISNVLEAFDTSNGRLAADSALVTGYDFLTDGSEAVAGALESAVTVDSSLVNDSWTAADLRAKLTEPSAAPDLASVNAHFDHYQLLPAAGEGDPESELFTTVDIDEGAADLTGRILFSMGCHSGTSAPDFYLGSSGGASLDWPQVFAQKRAIWVANSGFGYGDTAAVAYSEKLMARFAALLRDGERAGEALRLAKQAYLGEGLSNSYDAKVLAQSVYYGLPMYRVGPGAPAPVAPTFVPTTPDPSAGGVPSSTRTVAPDLRLSDPQTDGSRFVYAYDAAEPVEALREKTHIADGRPIQPRVDVDVTAAGLEARGSIVTALTMTDQALDVTVARPVVDLAANEPPIVAGDAVYPSAFSNVTTFENRAGARDHLVLVPGQWLADAVANNAPNTGRQRSFTSMTATVYYATAGEPDDVQPEISSTSGSASNGVTFRAAVSDRTDSGPGDVRRVVALYLDGPTWRSVDLVETSPGNFVGAGPAAGNNIEYLIQAVDAAGNVGVSSDKARLFDSTAAPVGGGGVNGSPIVVAGADVETSVGVPVTVSATFSDPDASTSWTAVAGNGAGATVSASVSAGAVTATLPGFGAPGVFDVSVSVCDDANACGVDSFQVTVSATDLTVTADCTILSFGQTITWWGFDNDAAAPITMPIGAFNRFGPSPPDRGQPTLFPRGDTRSRFATQDGATVGARWQLGGTSATAMSARGCA